MGLLSSSTTHGNSNSRDGNISSWNNYDGMKDSHDVQATQMNEKNLQTGEHIYYNTKLGREGATVGKERERDWK